MVDQIVPVARSRNRDVRVLAIQALAVCLGESEAALKVTLKYSRDRVTQIRLAVASALHPGTCDDHACLQTLTRLCADSAPVVRAEAAARLLEFPELTCDLIPTALNLLRAGDIRCDRDMMEQALRLMERVCSDVPGLLCAEFDADSIAAMKVIAGDIAGVDFPGQDRFGAADPQHDTDAEM